MQICITDVCAMHEKFMQHKYMCVMLSEMLDRRNRTAQISQLVRALLTATYYF